MAFWSRKTGAAPLVSDGGTIAHGLSKTPRTVRVTATLAGTIPTVTSIGATTFTVALKTPVLNLGVIGLASAASAQTIYWVAEL